MRTSCPAYVPGELVEWFEAIEPEIPGPFLDIYRRLIFDPRMEGVWQWYVSSTRLNRGGDPEDRVGTIPYQFCWHVRVAMRMPAKPGDMPPKSRAKYFDDVRRHALALVELLADTRFDCANQLEPELTLEELQRSLQKAIEPSWPENEGPVFAFFVGDLIARRAPSDYPESHLVEQLDKVVAWSEKPDCWDRGGQASSAPITRSCREASRIGYFTRTLYGALSKIGYSIPFSELATLANVALELGADESVDEGTVGRQVGRFHKRLASATGGDLGGTD